MIYLKGTSKENVFEIFDGKQPIGKLYTKSPGAIVLRPKSVFRKYDAFGLNKEILILSKYIFKWIIVFYEGKEYITIREKIIQDGIEESFDFGIKVFLPRNKWETRETSNQLSFVFKEEQ
ncbi:MAG: hypothetical protein ACYC49_09880 [Ignavibacteriaceae bacterium]